MSLDKKPKAVSVGAPAPATLKRKRQNQEDDHIDYNSKISSFERLLSSDDIQLNIVRYLDYNSFDEYGCVSKRCKQIHDHDSLSHLRTAVVTVSYREDSYAVPRLVLKLKAMNDSGIFRKYNRLKIQETFEPLTLNVRQHIPDETRQILQTLHLSDVKTLDYPWFATERVAVISQLLPRNLPNLKEVNYSCKLQVYQ